MASRGKKDSEQPSGEAPPEEKKSRKKRISAKTSSVPRKLAKRTEESEAQTLGVDVVPTVEITTAPTTEHREPTTLLSDWDYHPFNEGSHNRLRDKLAPPA